MAAEAGVAGGAAGTGIMATIGGGISSAASAIGSGLSSAGSALAPLLFNPITATLAALWAAWEVFGKKETPSFNAGFMLSPLGIAGEYGVDPFASGIQPAGFTRRAEKGEADSVVDTFRALDATIVGLYKSAGIDFKLSGSGISGYNEEGMGSGRFYGLAGQDGKPGAPLDQQMNRYTKEMFEKGSHFGLPDQLIKKITSAGNYADMIQTAKDLIDGSHANGLNYVPRDGYIAELHKGERVLTASQAKQGNQVEQKLEQVIQILQRNGTMAVESAGNIAKNTGETAKQLRDAVRSRGMTSGII